ncbi:MAG: Rrf2 family transcriptional regulator [Candidatus Abyssobacteria bacterium SURF_17]|jgi:Rrf2 family protein|uniref:Rrf2 family transcriptional regulator n=1 Tax=Candidatus Abyssobacteria bacterium SURF_17 TaxID=2093361 RepID=A0A419ETQ6_9BACT|nr:MAG: Rrf2 family transcriptional regulator [Candidatus Abyssubacteria bacterium SURF_17]
MSISQKCQYALRATFELAKHVGEGPVRIADIAKTQAIPIRFLEVILNQLKQGGFVESRRGSTGGYVLTHSPATLTVGEIIRFIEGPLSPVQCIAGSTGDQCPLHGDCAFLPMWEKVKDALSDVYDSTTFEDLVEQERVRRKEHVLDYSI